MQTAIDRVIKTYVMMADLTSKRHSDARAKCPEIWRTEALTSRCRPLKESSSCHVMPRTVVVQLQRSTASSSSRAR